MRGLRVVTIALFVFGAVFGAVPARAYAQDTHTSSVAADPTSSPATAPTGELWTQPSGRGFSTSFANGLWGGGLFSQEARLAVPLGTEHVRGQLRAQLVHRFGDPYIFDFGMRLGIVGGTLPLMNFVRAYGSGGIGFLLPVAGHADADKIRLGASGEFGVEVFLTSGMAIFVEVGGGGYFSGTYASGGHAMGGMNFYPF